MQTAQLGSFAFRTDPEEQKSPFYFREAKNGLSVSFRGFYPLWPFFYG
jgi:hypothetical protein